MFVKQPERRQKKKTVNLNWREKESRFRNTAVMSLRTDPSGKPERNQRAKAFEGERKRFRIFYCGPLGVPVQGNVKNPFSPTVCAVCAAPHTALCVALALALALAVETTGSETRSWFH